MQQNFTLVVMIAGTVGFQLPVRLAGDHMPGRAFVPHLRVWTAVTAALLPIAVRRATLFMAVVFLWVAPLCHLQLESRASGRALQDRSGNRQARSPRCGVGGPRGTPLAGGAITVGPIGLPLRFAGIFGAARCGHHAQLQMVGSPLQRCASPARFSTVRCRQAPVRSGLDSTMAPSRAQIR